MNECVRYATKTMYVKRYYDYNSTEIRFNAYVRGFMFALHIKGSI